MITDVGWFASVLNSLGGSNIKSCEFEELKNSIGASLPVWNYIDLKEHLIRMEILPKNVKFIQYNYFY